MYTKVENEQKEKKGLLSEFKDNYKYMQVTYDLNFIKYEIFAAIICMVFLGIILALGYRMPFADPIGNMKAIFISVQIVLSVASVLAIGIVAKFTKQKDSLLRNFLILSTIFLISIFSQALFLGSIGKEYNEIKFGEFYEKYENVETSENRTTLSLSTQGISKPTGKKDYIDVNKSSFNAFIIRCVVLIVLQVIILGFSLYVLYKLMNTREKLSTSNSKAVA